MKMKSTTRIEKAMEQFKTACFLKISFFFYIFIFFTFLESFDNKNLDKNVKYATKETVGLKNTKKLPEKKTFFNLFLI